MSQSSHLKNFKALVDVAINEKLMAQLAQLLRLRIIERVAKGEDPKGDPFPPYSEKWRMVREEAGRPTGVRDLFFKGHMLGALTHRIVSQDKNSIEAELFFDDAQQAAKAHGHHFGYEPFKLPATGFFAASEQDVAEMVEEARKFVMGKN